MSVIKLKRSATANKAPDVNSLQLGEVAINTYDGHIYMKSYNGQFDIKKFINETKLQENLANGTYTIKLTEDSLNLALGKGLSVDSDTNKVVVNLGTGLNFDDNGAIATSSSDTTTTTKDMILSNNWQTNLGNLEQYTYNIDYDGNEYHIIDGGRDVYDDGNYIKTNDNRLSYSTSIYKSAGFLLFSLNDIYGIKFYGETGADSVGQVDVQTNVVINDAKTINTSYKVIHNGRGGDPAIHHIVFSEKQVSNHKNSDDTNNDYDEYLFDTTGKVYLMVMWSNSTDAWDAGNISVNNIYSALFE